MLFVFCFCFFLFFEVCAVVTKSFVFDCVSSWTRISEIHFYILFLDLFQIFFVYARAITTVSLSSTSVDYFRILFRVSQRRLRLFSSFRSTILLDLIAVATIA